MFLATSNWIYRITISKINYSNIIKYIIKYTCIINWWSVFVENIFCMLCFIRHIQHLLFKRVVTYFQFFLIINYLFHVIDKKINYNTFYGFKSLYQRCIYFYNKCLLFEFKINYYFKISIQLVDYLKILV